MKSTLIKQAQIINEGKIFTGDVLIKSGRIERIDTTFQMTKRKY
ncbi:MAG: hypothetical protein R2852_08615 [Bacteroidia bacterium]